MEQFVPSDLLDQLARKQTEKDQADTELAHNEYTYIQTAISDRTRDPKFKQELLDTFLDPKIVVPVRNLSVLENGEAMDKLHVLLSNKFPHYFRDESTWVFPIVTGKIKRYTKPVCPDAIPVLEKKIATLTRDQARLIMEKKATDEKARVLSDTLHQMTESSGENLTVLQTRYRERLKALEALNAKKDQVLDERKSHIEELIANCGENEKKLRDFSEQFDSFKKRVSEREIEIGEKEIAFRDLLEEKDRLISEKSKEIEEMRELLRSKQEIERRHEKFSNLSQGKSANASSGTLTKKNLSVLRSSKA